MFKKVDGKRFRPSAEQIYHYSSLPMMNGRPGIISGRGIYSDFSSLKGEGTASASIALPRLSGDLVFWTGVGIFSRIRGLRSSQVLILAFPFMNKLVAAMIHSSHLSYLHVPAPITTREGRFGYGCNLKILIGGQVKL